jgi:hypothetical protein
MQRFFQTSRRVIASRTFFICVIVLFVLQAVWLACSFRYPMLWDEYYHFGLAQFYAHHINPIINHQPNSLDIFGNVARSPKYLYHYLMSFPLRGIGLFTDNQTLQIIFLRFINIGLFAGGLVAYRQALLFMTKSRALVHFVLLLVALLPLSTLLAAEINYDNLQFLMTGLVLYWTFRFVRAKRFEVAWLMAIVGAGLLTATAKYSFFPILAPVIVYLAVYAYRRWRKRLLKETMESFKRLKRWRLAGLILLVILGLGFSVERFGVNLARYHALDPDCQQIISVERCLNFSPYKHEYVYNRQLTPKMKNDLYGPIGYTRHDWLPGMFTQYFTTGTQLQYEVFVVQPALHIPLISFLVVMSIAIVCFLLKSRELIRRHDVQLVLVITVVLSASLWLVDYGKYRYTGFPLAIQGRYVAPIIPALMMIGALGVQRAVKWEEARLALAAIAAVGLLWGGGLLTHIALSDSSWYWQNQVVININDSISRIINPILF